MHQCGAIQKVSIPNQYRTIKPLHCFLSNSNEQNHHSARQTQIQASTIIESSPNMQRSSVQDSQTLPLPTPLNKHIILQ